MGDAAFRTGWRIYRAHRPEAVDPVRDRRRRMVAGTAAALVGTLLTVTLAIWHWTPAPLPVAALGVLALAAAAGSIAAYLVPVAPPREDWSFHPTGDWRRSERIARQFAPRPPAIAPEDRDEVLTAAQVSRIPLVVTAERALFLPGFWVTALIGAALLGQFDGTGWVVLVGPVFGLLQSATLVAAVTALGRAELARRRAEALPPSPPPPPERPRGRGPTGTKLGLPD